MYIKRRLDEINNNINQAWINDCKNNTTENIRLFLYKLPDLRSFKTEQIGNVLVVAYTLKNYDNIQIIQLTCK